MAHKGTETDIQYGVAIDRVWWCIKGLKLMNYMTWRADTTAHVCIAHTRLNFLTAKWLNVIAFQVNRLSLLDWQPSMPHSMSVSVALYAITMWSIATPYMSVSVPLYTITAQSITNQHEVALLHISPAMLQNLWEQNIQFDCNTQCHFQ